jgi:predicted peptidase
VPAVDPRDRVAELPPGTHAQTAQTRDGTAVRYTISVPAGYTHAAPAPLIVVLHYAGQVTPFFGRGILDGLAAPAFAPLHAILVAPDAPAGDWTTEQSDAAVAWLTRAVMNSYAVDPRRVAVTGYSMGGIGSWSIGARHQDLFTAAIPIASQPVGDPRWRIPLYVIHSRDDELLPIAPTRDYVHQLAAAGARIEWRELRGLTHYDVGGYVPALREASSWLAQIWSAGSDPRTAPR